MIISKPAQKSHSGVLRAFCLTVALLVPMLLAAVPALADPEMDSMQAEADRIQAEISSINQSAAQAIERYNQANIELEGTETSIAENQATLEQATADLAEAQQRLNKRMENIYRDGGISFMDVIMNTNSFSEFMSRFELLGRIGSQDKADVEEVLRLKQAVEDARAQLEEDRVRQEELVQTLAAEKSEVESQLAARQSVLDGVEGEIAQIIAQQEQQQAALPAVTPGAPDSGQAPPAGPPPTVPGPPMPAPPAPPPSSGGVVSIAMQYLGVPYVWGGASPSGFDCSGLVMYSFAQMGVYLPHSAAAQFYSGTPISSSALAPGDLVFFGSPIYHVGIYIGGGSMIHAPFEGANVSIVSIWAVGGYSGACRI